MIDTTFQPRYLLDDEIGPYGLPSVDQLPNVMNLVDAASSLIDADCGRVDSLGNGSLVYTTYSERLYLPPGRNIFRVSFTPMVSIDTSTALALSGQTLTNGNHFYNGFTPNTSRKVTGDLTAIVSASGRYGYARRDQQATYPDLNYGANILTVAAFFGGPPQWTGIDETAIDYFDQVGECWVPAGIYLSQYTEVLITYNSGFNPLAMPKNIKHATAALVKNFIVRGGGTTSIKGYSAGKIHAQFTEELLDLTIERMLSPYHKTVAM